MPRKLILEVKKRPKPIAKRRYILRIDAIEKGKSHDDYWNSSTGIVASIEFLNKEQTGRKDLLFLPLPIYPDSLTADFFRACGIDISFNKKIRAEKATGSIITIVFGTHPNSTGVIPIAFKPILEESNAKSSDKSTACTSDTPTSKSSKANHNNQ